METPLERADDRPNAILLAWAATLLACVGVTWRLWTPLRDTPRVAPSGLLGGVPPAFDYALLLLLAFGLWRAISSRDAWRRGVVIATAALAASMAFDQLRWQPWAWHAVLAGVVFAASSGCRTLSGLRALAVAVYAYSAVAKLDAEFVGTLGQQMLDTLPGADRLPDGARQAIAWTMPVFEFAIAGLLAASVRWRRIATTACIAVATLHIGLIGVLGPLGLGHSLGVLLWNAGFAVQTVVLFRPSGPQPDTTGRIRVAGWAACVLGVAAPALAPFGYWDQWPGWALYAPGGERASLFVHQAVAERLPDALTPFVDLLSDGVWRRVRLDDWVLADTGAPLYPQIRVKAAIALGLAKRYPLGGRLQLITESAAGRLSRARTSLALDGPMEIERASRRGVLFKPSVVWTR